MLLLLLLLMLKQKLFFLQKKFFVEVVVLVFRLTRSLTDADVRNALDRRLRDAEIASLCKNWKH